MNGAGGGTIGLIGMTLGSEGMGMNDGRGGGPESSKD